MRAAALRYRVMAYITGVLIIVVCFVGIPLQVAAHNTFIVNDIGTLHGFLYIVYIVFAYILAQKLKMKIGPTVTRWPRPARSCRRGSARGRSSSRAMTRTMPSSLATTPTSRN